jgi:hypothetical protein
VAVRATRLALALVFGLLVSAGSWLVYPPAGLILAGLQGYAGLYVTAYLVARSGRPR